MVLGKCSALLCALKNVGRGQGKHSNCAAARMGELGTAGGGHRRCMTHIGKLPMQQMSCMMGRIRGKGLTRLRIIKQVWPGGCGASVTGN